MNRDLDAIQTLLETVELLPESVVDPPTYMEIAGYPHIENVCSNILAHYLDPNTGHNLGMTILRGLMMAAGLAPDALMLGDVDVDREVMTTSGKRIDIVVNADSFMIGIENKLFAASYNDFKAYRKYLDGQAEPGQRVRTVLLALQRPDTELPGKFVPVTYDDFFESALPLVGKAAVDGHFHQLSIFLDFAKSIQNLVRGSSMNRDFMDLLEDRIDAAEHFLDEIGKLQREMRQKVKEVSGMIDSLPDGVAQSYWRSRPLPFDILVHQLEWTDRAKIQIDAILSPKGWEVVVFSRDGASISLDDVLSTLGYKTEPWEKDSDRSRIRSLDFSYDDDIALKEKLGELIEKLAEYRRQNLG